MTSPHTCCEWSGCEAPVVARVSFGYRLRDPEPIPAMHELSLCGPHIAQVRLDFLIVETKPINEIKRRVRGA